MRGSEVGDEWAEDDGVDALADREHGCDAGQERGRPELRVDQRRRHDAEERNRPERARRIRLTTRVAGSCAITMKDVLKRKRIPIAPGPTRVCAFTNGGRMFVNSV